jgi:shikimate kinase
VKTNFTGRGIAVTGAIGAGKSTLAARLAQELGAVLLSSDAIRESLSRKQQRKGSRVFAQMRDRFLLALAGGDTVVLDSTGMSGRFRALLHAHRAEIAHVHLTLDDAKRFDERERQRTDRASGPLPFAAFKHSQRIVFYDPPDLVIATDEISAEEVYLQVCQSGTMGGGAV